MFVMGLLGGIFGVIASLLAMFIGGAAAAFGADGAGQITGLAVAALLLSVLGIVGAALVNSKPKLGGAFMLAAGVGGFICIFMFYILSAILFVVAGFMGVLKKNNQVQNVQQ
jgi:hypothetical protein